MNDVIEYQPVNTLPMKATEVRAQVQLVQEIMREVMKEGEHYGVIPGTGTKPSLLKAGAEKLCMTFHLGPDYEIVDKERDGDHLTITSKCILTHIPSGRRVGSALGSSSTKESKYAYRKGARKCPQCDSEAIIKGKAEYGGGWLCFAKKGGCGAKFEDGDPSIESQETGKIDNEDKADQYNTVLKMSNKRALLAVVLNATAASDIFTQDLLDEGDISRGSAEEVQPQRAQPKKAVAQPQAKSKPDVPVDPSKKIAPGQVKVLQTAIDNAGLSAADVCTHFGIEALPDLPFAKINEALKHVAEAGKSAQQGGGDQE